MSGGPQPGPPVASTAAAPPAPRAWGVRGLRVFSSDRGAARVRRPTDVLVAAGSALVLLALAAIGPGPTGLDRQLADALGELDGLWRGLWAIGYALLALWPIVVLLLSLARPKLLAKLLLAAVGAIVVALATGWLAGGDLAPGLGRLVGSGPPPAYPGTRLALATAVLATAAPHLSRPFRRLGPLVLLGGAVSTVALGTAYPLGSVAAVAAGLLAAALVHLALGSPGGQLTPAQVAEALAELGLDASGVRLAPLQPAGVALFEATDPGGRGLLVKVFGRDAWDSQFLGSLWNAAMVRGERPALGRTRMSQLEHEAVATLLAERAGVPVLPVVTVGQTPDGDALLVTGYGGRSIAQLPPGEVTDAHLDAAWRAVAALHAAGIAHGRLTLGRLVALDGGGVALADLSLADLAPDDGDLGQDRARLHAALATVAGPQRALAAALPVLGPDGVAAMLPYLQPAVLDPATRRALPGGDEALEGLRADAAAAAGVEPPPLVRLRRVTWRGLVFTALGSLLAYFVISKLAHIDFSELAAAFEEADWVWLVGALLLSPFVQVWSAASTLGASLKRLRYAPVLMLQYAIQFLAVTVPSSAARMALTVRFFQRFGIAAAAALSMSAIDSFAGLVVQIALLLIIGLTALPGLTEPLDLGWGSDDGGDDGLSVLEAVLLVGGIAIAAAVIALLIPRVRARLRARIPELREQLRGQSAAARRALVVLRHPRKVALMLVGNFGAQLLQAVILGVCLAAFGERAHLSQLVLINTIVALFGGLMPVPGNVGVAEAGYTAGLQAVGVPAPIALSTALAFRMVTFYLPPLWGAPAMAWLRRRSYV